MLRKHNPQKILGDRETVQFGPELHECRSKISFKFSQF
jgi:hypothetical protein